LCACARLIVVHLRIKFKQHSWLRQKLTVFADLPAMPAIQDLMSSAMHESVRLAARVQLWPAASPDPLYWLICLPRGGCPAKVNLGITKHGDVIGSHARVEVNGCMVDEPASVINEFVPIALSR
jgi:hypothetical protein